MSTRTSLVRFWSTRPLTMLPSANDFIVLPNSSCMVALMGINNAPFSAGCLPGGNGAGLDRVSDLFSRQKNRLYLGGRGLKVTFVRRPDKPGYQAREGITA